MEKRRGGGVGSGGEYTYTSLVQYAICNAIVTRTWTEAEWMAVSIKSDGGSTCVHVFAMRGMGWWVCMLTEC